MLLVKKVELFTITGFEINSEILEENVMDNTGNMKLYKYNKINGVKYYYDEYVEHKWFSIKNGEKTYTSETFKQTNDAAIRYYKEALNFKNNVIIGYGLNNLTTDHAVDEHGNKIASNNGWRKL